MTVTAVVTAHGPESDVAGMVAQLHAQTQPPHQILVYASDVPDSILGRLDGCTVTVCPNENDWGHAKRAAGLAAADGRWVGFFNDDDRYHPDYIEAMTGTVGTLDLVMCRWDEKGTVRWPTPTVGSCTAGNFLARTKLARQAGWSGRHYEADGQFITDLVAAGARWTVEDRLLYWHK